MRAVFVKPTSLFEIPSIQTRQGRIYKISPSALLQTLVLLR